MANKLLGLDIGACQLKLTLSAPGRLIQAETVPLPDNLVREGRIVSYEAMADAIKAVLTAAHLRAKDCAVVLPRSQVFFRRMDMPPMTEEQVKLNLPYEFRDYTTGAADQYFYDYALLGMKKDEDGKVQEMDLMAAAAEKAVVADYTAMLRRAGLKLKLALPEEVAYQNLLRTCNLQPVEGGPLEICIIDLGHTATRVHIFKGGQFDVTRVVEYGGAMIDSAIASHFNVDDHIARSYKETNHEGAQSCEEARSVYGNIAVEIMRAVNFYGFNNPGSNLHRAYFCGGGARLQPLLDAIADTVDLEFHSIRELMDGTDEDSELDVCPVAFGVTQQ